MIPIHFMRKLLLFIQLKVVLYGHLFKNLTPSSGGSKPIIWQDFFSENCMKIGPRGGIPSHPLDLPMKCSVGDPGFPRGGGINSPGGAPTYNFVKFSQKLYEIERIWTPGGCTSKILLCRSATDVVRTFVKFKHIAMCVLFDMTRGSVQNPELGMQDVLKLWEYHYN